MIRRRTFQLAFVVLSFTTIVFTISSAHDGGTQHWYLFFSPLMLAASFYGTRGALVLGFCTLATLVLLYQNALTMLQALPFDPITIADRIGRSPASRLLGGDLNNSLFGTSLMLVVAVSMGYMGDRSRRLERQIAYMADHDALTALFNRRRFTDELDREILRCRAQGASSVLLYLDLDGFKQVNDKLGHAVGDILLKDIAKLLSAQTRGNDVVGRMGGDEFALLLPGVSRENAEVMSQRLLASVAAYQVPDNGLGLRVTASIGVAPMPGAATPPSQALLIEADEAMYGAKRAGKNQVHFASFPA